MRFKKMLTIVTLAILGLLTLGLPTTPQAAEFSADMDTRAQGQVVVQSKIFIKGDLSRHEMNQQGYRMILINRPDKGVAWTLMPQEKSYLEITVDPADRDEIMPQNWEQALKKEGKTLGQETANGIRCNKYELVDEDKEKVIYWIAEKEKLPVRIVTAETEINFRNLKQAKQPNQLFEIPAGYRKMVMPQMPGMDNMQGMPGSGNTPAFPISR
ncbi:MAG: DUF4412 domain-containing protein [Deltaproteobacteria bacterium]|nr:DUF4412 domain-containing protein [Deltaproteobacteria bacterium]